MNINELRKKLDYYNVPQHWYSLNDGLKPDACILFKNYSIWEYFYLDERGEKHEYKIFNNEESAFDFFWKKMEYQLAVFNIKHKDKKM